MSSLPCFHGCASCRCDASTKSGGSVAHVVPSKKFTLTVIVTPVSRACVVMLGLAVTCPLFVPVTPAQTPYDVKAHYIKRELFIPDA
jgi:hypothetical protein